MILNVVTSDTLFHREGGWYIHALLKWDTPKMFIDLRSVEHDDTCWVGYWWTKPESQR